MSGNWVPVVLAPFIGSFGFALALRYPDFGGFVAGRSVCPTCRHQLAARDLVPVVSWLLLRGRCRYCAAAIGWHYPAAELGAAILALWATTVFSGWLLWATSALGWALLALSIIDLRTYRLPDLLTVPILAAGLGVAAIAEPETIFDHLLGAAAGYAALAGIGWLYRAARGRDGLGCGDAKLLAAGGAWLSWQALPVVVLIAATLALLVTGLSQVAQKRSISADMLVPFGPYLAAAIWLVWIYGVPAALIY